MSERISLYVAPRSEGDAPACAHPVRNASSVSETFKMSRSITSVTNLTDRSASTAGIHLMRLVVARLPPAPPDTSIAWAKRLTDDRLRSSKSFLLSDKVNHSES